MEIWRHKRRIPFSDLCSDLCSILMNLNCVDWFQVAPAVYVTPPNGASNAPYMENQGFFSINCCLTVTHSNKTSILYACWLVCCVVALYYNVLILHSGQHPLLCTISGLKYILEPIHIYTHYYEYVDGFNASSFLFAEIPLILLPKHLSTNAVAFYVLHDWTLTSLCFDAQLSI